MHRNNEPTNSQIPHPPTPSQPSQNHLPSLNSPTHTVTKIDDKRVPSRNKKKKPTVISVTQQSEDYRLINFLDKRLREIEEQKMFQREERRIREQLRKKNMIEVRGGKEKERKLTEPETVRQADSRISNSSLSPPHYKPVIAITQPQSQQSNRNVQRIEPWKNTASHHPQQPAEIPLNQYNPQPTRPSHPRKSSSPKTYRKSQYSHYAFQKPRFEVSKKDSIKEQEALDRIIRREEYCRRLKSEPKDNSPGPLDPENLIKWKIQQDKLANPSKYLRLKNVPTKEVFNMKGTAENKQHQVLIEKGNQYMKQAKKRAKKNAEKIVQIAEPAKQRYINYLPQVRKEYSVRSLPMKPSAQSLLQKARRLEMQTVQKIHNYVNQRNAGLPYTHRGYFEDSIDTSLIDYVRAKVDCIQNVKI